MSNMKKLTMAILAAAVAVAATDEIVPLRENP